jgi:hypothetical protein
MFRLGSSYTQKVAREAVVCGAEREAGVDG